jgi:hypothetical protein
MVVLLFDKEKKKWKELTDEEKENISPEDKARTLYLDRQLKDRLDFAKKYQKNNNDVVGLIEGDEGSGKSSLGGNVMRYMTDDTFNPLTQMVGSDYEDALKKIEEAPQGGHLMFDEGNVFFLSTETTKREHRDLHKIFSIFRQQNLFVLIILPSFLRMGTYFALDRTKFLLQTYMKQDKRGQFAYYGNKAKAKYYRLGKKDMYNRNLVAPNFRGKFTRCITLEDEEYKKFKLKTLRQQFKNARDGQKKPKSPVEIEREVKQRMVFDLLAKGYSKAETARVTNINPCTIYEWLDKAPQKEQEVIRLAE